MNRDEYARLKEIVASALSRPDADRPAYLTDQCGSDAAMRGEAESLLAAAVHASCLYEEPAFLVDGNPLTVEALEAVDAIPVLHGFPPYATRLAGALEHAFEGTDRYAVRRRIGAGGMGIVYEVEDRVRGQRVALKTLRRRGGEDIYQLKREFRNLADVAHPNLVSLYELHIDGEHCFFTMELVHGVTFVDYARRGSPGGGAAEQVRRLLPQLVEGIEELHRRGMQHRDIKPSNVLVTTDGRLVVLDFGLTSALLREQGGGGAVAGTPAYLSPEACLGGDVSNAGDWYGVGAMLYQALTGRVPFDGPLDEIAGRKSREDPPHVSALAPDTPHEVGEACMALLHRDPALRISGREALSRLAAADTGGAAAALESVDAVFVGRERHLNALDAAFDGVRTGRSVSVVIYGPSGIGKSSLVQRFIERRLDGEHVLVLRSRCHEHESIAYNGLDGVVDALTHHLSGLSAAERAARLPPDVSALARLFPVIRALGVEPDLIPVESDPILLRHRAFAACRELLTRVATQQPIVMDIDDYHWADADTARWLMGLLRSPAPPRLLILVSFRIEELDTRPLLRSLVERVDIGERVLLPVTPMSHDEVAQLVEALLPRGTASGAAPMDIARDSGGNPFLIDALARHSVLDMRTPGQTTLEEMLARRLDGLPRASRPFLEALAVCGRPMLPARVFEACGFAGDERPLVARLRAAHLLRTSRSPDRVELYHDRIRVALAAGVPPEDARRIHAVMADVLIAHGDDDPEALFEHYRAAGRSSLAATHAAAAGAKASAVLAFDLAASFYRHALTLDPNAPDLTVWTANLAKALENAGRPVEAADAFIEAAGRLTGADGIETRRKAAELFLIGGEIDRGLAVSADVLRAVGMRLARGPRTAVASLAVRRLQLRWRGLEFTPRDPSVISADDLLCIDACWAISSGLAMVDPIRAAAFNVKQLLRALDVGDPRRIARAFALEAGFSAIGLGAGLRRSAAFSRRAEALAARSGDQYVAALTALWEGIASFLTGQWPKASELCGRAVTILRDECTGVTWELNMAHNFLLGGLVAQGELREVARHLPGLHESCRERGNFYLELELHTRMILAALAADDPDGAQQRADDAIARWSQRGFQRQHYGHLLTRIQIELYRGRAGAAWALLVGREAALRRSLFLRVQHTRIERASYRGRSALAVAAEGKDGPGMRAIATRDAKRLARERMPWANALAWLIRATAAHQQGHTDRAVEQLTRAVAGFDAAHMQHYAAACRRRLSVLVGGGEGAELRARADRWMSAQDIRNPSAFTRLIAPGLPD